MRFLICGLGSIGRRHLKNLLALGEGDVVLLRTGKATLPGADLPDLPVEHDLDTALSRWKPEAVVVANPTALHLETALPAARAGCHLLIEKPLSHKLEGTSDLRQAVASGGGRALVGYQFRFHPTLKEAWMLIEGGAIGVPVSARANWGEYLPDWHPWEDYRRSYSARRELGGGVVLTLSHPFDYLRWLLGDVVQVKASVTADSELDIEVDDTANVTLHFASGAVATVHLDYVQQPPSHWLEVVGTQGALRWDNERGDLAVWGEGQKEWELRAVPDGFIRNTLFLDEMRHFIEVVRGEAEPLCSLEDGIRTLEICLAALRSSEQEREIPLESPEIVDAAE